MSRDVNELRIIGENACVVLWVAQAAIHRGYTVIVGEEHHRLVQRFFGNTGSIQCLNATEFDLMHCSNTVLVASKSDQQKTELPSSTRLIIAGIGYNVQELEAMALRFNPRRTIGADIVFGPGCHALPDSQLTKSITAAFHGNGFRIPYTGRRSYAYIEDFALAVIDGLSAPSPFNNSPILIGEDVDIEGVLRDLEYVFPYNGISAQGPVFTSPFESARLLPRSLLEGIEKSRSVLKQMSTG